jgi:transcriptional regulator with XRE-family HTH domain
MDSASKLDYLLKTLEISGKEIASKLDIDETTVSKWRNNQRKLTYKSKYTGLIAEILLSSEIERKRHIIADILKRYKKDINPQSRWQQIDSLCLWLTEKPSDIDAGDGGKDVYSPRNGYNTSVNIFLGEYGVDEALEYCMKYLLRMPPGRTLYVIDFNGINWTNGDESTDPQLRINASIDLFNAFIENGHKFVIVDCNTDIYRPYKAIFRWMRLYLMEGVEVWAHQPIGQDKNYFIDFVMRNEIALHCAASDVLPEEERHCVLFKNREPVNSFANSAEAILQRSKKMIETVENDKIHELIEAMEGYFKPGLSVYMLNPSLTLQHTGEDILNDILAENGAEDEKIDTCLLINDKYAAIQRQCGYKSIFDLDMLEQISDMDVIIDHNLSSVCRREIKISRYQWTRLLQSIRRGRNTEDFSTVFASFKHLRVAPTNLSIFVQDDTFVSAWDMQKYKKSMYCVNLDVVSGFYRYVDDIWHMVPGICKDPDWRNKQLERVLESK